MIGKETGHLLECVLYKMFINKSETGNIAATSLRILVKNHYSVKCYDKSNMNVITCTLSL